MPHQVISARSGPGTGRGAEADDAEDGILCNRTFAEWREIRPEYEGDDYTIAEICERHNTNKTAIRKAVIRFGWRPRAPRRIDRGDAIERLFRLLERQIKQLEIGGPVEGKDAAGTLVRLVNTLAKLTALRAAEIARRHREAAKPGISDIKVKLIERIEQLKRS